MKAVLARLKNNNMLFAYQFKYLQNKTTVLNDQLGQLYTFPKQYSLKTASIVKIATLKFPTNSFRFFSEMFRISGYSFYTLKRFKKPVHKNENWYAVGSNFKYEKLIAKIHLLLLTMKHTATNSHTILSATASLYKQSNFFTIKSIDDEQT